MKKPTIAYPLSIDKYTKAHIDYLIEAKAEESIHLEFKAAGALDTPDSKKAEIAKDVSAMSNSDGGVLIYGLNEVDHTAHSYSFINGEEYSKEWLEQIINSKIKRRIPGLTIDVIRVGNKISQSIYVVRIPRSDEGPHMSTDGRYYKRFNFESVRMAEYEVRDAFSRSSNTQLKLLPAEISRHIIKNDKNKLLACRLDVVLDVHNVSRQIEETYKTIIRIPKAVYLDSIENQNISKFFRKFQPDYALLNIPGNTALFPKEVNTLANFFLLINKQNYAACKAFPLRIRFYYSNGIYELEYDLLQQVRGPKGKRLKLADFG